ncbi:hypothetical protein MNBD_GAMMA20-533 [hydrothermal vent metagenome]|uniref:Uncharacterized protein n=1 Tax=hydrothermal vent metagenome TaxID=652676 RepID=A0A3B1ASP1_9ZZZZ
MWAVLPGLCSCSARQNEHGVVVHPYRLPVPVPATATALSTDAVRYRSPVSYSGMDFSIMPYFYISVWEFMFEGPLDHGLSCQGGIMGK